MQRYVGLLVSLGLFASINVHAAGLSRGFTTASDFRWLSQIDTNSLLKSTTAPMSKPAAKAPQTKAVTEKPAKPETKPAKINVTKPPVDPRKVNLQTATDKKTEEKNRKKLPNLRTTYEQTDFEPVDKDPNRRKVLDTRNVFEQRTPTPKKRRHGTPDWP